MKTIFHFNQFFHQNDPKIASLIGNLALILAFVSGTIMSLPTMFADAGVAFVLPAFLVTVAKYCTVAGIAVKFLAKMFGTIDANGNPVSTLPFDIKN